jgi:hypothetical protein
MVYLQQLLSSVSNFKKMFVENSTVGDVVIVRKLLGINSLSESLGIQGARRCSSHRLLNESLK